MLLPELNDFSLVGGTALALRYGHRRSVDLDLFALKDFDYEFIINVLSKKFPGFSFRSGNNTIGVFGFIDDIKIDLVKYHFHPLIEELNVVDTIRMFSTADIMAMKINAILKRGQKKYFLDISELLKEYSVKELITCYGKKYPEQRLLISIPQALTYFADAEQSEDPVSLKGQTWESVKHAIRKQVSDYLK